MISSGRAYARSGHGSGALISRTSARDSVENRVDANCIPAGEKRSKYSWFSPSRFHVSGMSVRKVLAHRQRMRALTAEAEGRRTDSFADTRCRDHQSKNGRHQSAGPVMM